VPSILNTPQDIPHVVFDIPIVKSQDVQSAIVQTSFSSLSTMEFVTMTRTIDLNDQF